MLKGFAMECVVFASAGMLDVRHVVSAMIDNAHGLATSVLGSKLPLVLDTVVLGRFPRV